MRPVAAFCSTTSFRASDSTTVPSPRRRQRLQKRALLAFELAFERGVHGRDHVLRHHVGQEPETAAVDSEQRHVMTRHEARAVEQGAVAADGDEEIRLLREVLFGESRDRRSARRGYPPPR